MTNFFKLIFVKPLAVIAASIISLASMAGVTPTAPSQNLGSALPSSPALIDTYLASGIGTTDTSMTLATGQTVDGVSLAGYMCFTIDVNTPSLEYVCGNASGTAVTNMIRGVGFWNPNTTSSLLAFVHRRFATVQATDYPTLQLIVRQLTGQDTFTSGTVLQYDPGITNAQVSANGQNLVNMNVLASTSFAGVVNANTATKGIIQEATPAQIASGTGVGSTGADLIVANRNTCITASTTPCAVVASGTIAKNFIATTTNYGFTNQILSITTATSTATMTDSFNILPAGVVSIYAASSTAPTGWLLCDGTVYNSSTYPRLYTVLTQTYGGSSSTGTFAVPNMKGNFIAGAGGQFGGVGATGGAATSSVSGSITTSNVGATGGPTGFAANGTYALNNGLATTTPPYIIENFIIKY